MTEYLAEQQEKVSDCNMRARPDYQKQDPDELIEKLIGEYRSYRPDDDVSQIRDAYEVAKQAHKDQRRKSGAPYIIHPVSVAIILAELEMDKESIIAALLHDVVEDTNMTLDDVRERFGEGVANLVDGVTKLTRISWEGGKEEMQAENLRKMFLAMSQDIRVILIKLADRTHNMRTLQFMSPEKQKEKAQETLDIYSPLASRLGISKLKVELDNLSLQYLEPEEYERIVSEIDQKKTAREEYIAGIVDEVRGHIEHAGIKAEVYGRVKHYFSIYKKMLTQHKSIDEIYDLFAVRIIVDTVQDCYAALGVIHELYTPIPGRFKDYIAMPKLNHYQSLHTTLIGKDGTPFEVQIRTAEMHRIAEYGIAAHWKYKEGGTAGISSDEEKLSWLRQILEWQKDMSDDGEFLSSIKTDLDLFSDNVYCFTPGGDIKVLPKGSTPVDFAYMIHSAVGNRMVGARVNDKLVNIDYELKNGDRIEIITSQNSRGPSRDWLGLAKSTQARNKINQWFRSQNKEDNIIRGKEAMENYCHSKGVDYSELTKPELVGKILRKYGFQDWDSVVAAVGHGGLKEGQIINKLIDEKTRAEKKVITDESVLAAVAENRQRGGSQKASGGIVVEGIDDMSFHMAKCCNPIPGDEIVGFVTRGRGISIHRTDCVNIINLPEIERARMLEAEWAVPEDHKETYVAQISIYANDRVGLLADISRIMAEQNVGIQALRTQTNKQGVVTIIIDFETSGVDEINRLMSKIRQIDHVVDIQRTTG